MKRAVQIILCVSCLGFMGCCFTPAVFLTRTCDGRIVDADTDAPIEGVVVLGVCYRESFIWATDTVNEFCGAWVQILVQTCHPFRNKVATDSG